MSHNLQDVAKLVLRRAIVTKVYFVKKIQTNNLTLYFTKLEKEYTKLRCSKQEKLIKIRIKNFRGQKNKK